MRLVKPRLVVGLIIVTGFFLLGFIVPFFAPEDPTAWNTYFRNLPPSAEHIMGTNNLGQDIFWLLSWSIRNSLWIGSECRRVGHGDRRAGGAVRPAFWAASRIAS